MRQFTTLFLPFFLTLLNSTPTYSLEQQFPMNENTAGVLSSERIEKLKASWHEDFSKGESAEKNGDLQLAENSFFESAIIAISISPFNELSMESLKRLSELYSRGGNKEALADCQSCLEKTKNYFAGELPPETEPNRSNASLGKLSAFLEKSVSAEHTPKALVDSWKKQNSKALADEIHAKAIHDFSNAYGYASAKINPPLNIESETSLTNWANFEVRRKSPDSAQLVNSAEFNTKFNLPESNALRQKVALLKAAILMREGKFEEAHKLVGQVQSTCSAASRDAGTRANCNLVNAEIFEYQGELKEARTEAQAAVDFFKTQKGVDNIPYADALRCLARVERAEKNYEKSLTTFGESLSKAKLALGDKNPALAPFYFDLGTTYLLPPSPNIKLAAQNIQSATELGRSYYNCSSVDLRTYELQNEAVRSSQTYRVAIPGAPVPANELPQ